VQDLYVADGSCLEDGVAKLSLRRGRDPHRAVDTPTACELWMRDQTKNMIDR
jgi:hypothetical protein